MSRTECIRTASRRSPSVSSSLSLLLLVGLTLALAGCSPEGVDPGNGNGNGNGNGDGDGDGGTPLDDTVTAVAAEIADGHLDTPYLLDATGSLNPTGRVLVYLWEVDAPEGSGCEGGSIADSSSPLTSFTPDCRGVHRVTLTVTLVDGTGSTKAERSFSVDNRAPVLSGLEQESAFLPGVDVVIAASVADDDGDPTTCTARLADDNAGDPTGLVIPSEPSSSCSFTISTPVRVDTWKVEVVANDGFDDSQRSTVELTPGNDPPVINDVTADVTSVPYACADDACAATAVRVTVTSSDDTDDFLDLDIALNDVTGTLPEGVVVDVTPVAGTHGAFDVLVSRPDLGAIAGSYSFEVSVTELTAAETPATVTQDIAIEVTNAAPIIATVTADDVGHKYSSDDGVYSATLLIGATQSDAENNALTKTIELVSCPTAATDNPACDGAELTVEVLPPSEAANEGDLELLLTTTDLAKLAGEYQFRVTVTDPDGATAVEEPTLTVRNAAPVLATGFVSAVQQAYVGSAHTASVPLVYDPDGDPMIFTLSALCGDSSLILALPGSCSSDQSVTIDDEGTLHVSGPAAGLLGNYIVEGQVSDGVGVFGVDVTLTVQNTAPTLVRNSLATQTCDHLTSGTAVTNASDCSYSFDGDAADANGDPLTVTRVEVPSNGYTVTGTTPTSPATDGSVSFTYGLSTTYSHFVSTFSGQTESVTVRVSDPFGYDAEVVVTPLLDNRAPVPISRAFRNLANTKEPPKLAVHQLKADETAARHYDDYADGTATYGDPYEFSIVVEAVDDDGDPLRISLGLTCSDYVQGTDGFETNASRTLPSDGRIPLRIPGVMGTCGSAALKPRVREWALDRVCLSGAAYCIDLVPVMRCVLSGSGTQLSDGISSVGVSAGSLSHNIELPASLDPYGC